MRVDADRPVGIYHRPVPKLEHIASGKVREIYRIDEERLLIVASDRISAYDVVLDDTIPDKGRVLTGLTAHWLDTLDTPHHLLETGIENVPGIDDDDMAWLAGRAMVVRAADVIPMECVVRGFLYGSSWREYRDGGGPTTEHLPTGLRQADRLPEPVFTPATKAASGHDENLTEAAARHLVGDDRYEALRDRSIGLYLAATEYAAGRGIMLADTKFEFGVVDGDVILIDEVLTPDSSRWWPADEWAPGGTVPSFDKQFVRDALDDLGWDHTPPAPRLSQGVIADTRARYVDAFERLTQTAFAEYLKGQGVR